jgi:DNA-binding NarL/FixJ family response regulator
MHKPDVALIDIRMPPTQTDEGLRAAQQIRERWPDTGVLVLSQYVEPAYAMELLGENAEGVGYLLKDRVSDVDEFAAAVRRVAEAARLWIPRSCRSSSAGGAVTIRSRSSRRASARCSS